MGYNPHMEEVLVLANKYAENIKILGIQKRITIDYPILVRNSVAEKLARVANKLPKEYMLQIDSGLRDIKTQKALWDNRYKEFKKKNPSLPEQQIYKMTSSIVGDPDKTTSTHVTGGAVDIALTNAKGTEINLSEPFQKYYEEPQLKSEKISQQAQKLRMLLNKLMLEEEFAPNPNEYWHFSYGDRNWAKYYNKQTLYESIEVPEKYKYLFLKKIIIRVQRKIRQGLIALFNIKTNY